MARLLGRYQTPGCCPGTRSGLPPGPDCSGGGSVGTRKAKRLEARELAAEIDGELHPEPDLEHLATLGPLYDLSDCEHGCNGSPSCGERCTFICHPVNSRPRLVFMNVSYPGAEHDPGAGASYAILAPGGIPDGSVARTIEATESIWVDTGADGTILGVEVIGEGNWVDGLVALAMTGRLRVAPAVSFKSRPD